MQINVKYLSAFYFFISVFIGFSCPILAKDSTLVIVIDAEFGLPNSTSAQAIGLGAQLAINDIEASGLLKDRKLVIERSDNRGVPAIGVDNLSKAAERLEVVAVMGGKFSPVYMEQRPLADRLGMILLDPWGSADGITKMGETANWAFRLSLTDQWAAPAFMDEAKRRSIASGRLFPIQLGAGAI
jgi:branched-chain amino acid transport system substrate-binding protein